MRRAGELALALYRADQVRELDRIAIEEHGLAGITLMERAGRSAFVHLRRRWPHARRIAIACGAGNNAGDGFIVARLAAEAGLEVTVAMLARPERLRGAAAEAYAAMRGAGISPGTVDALLGSGPDVVVDGLLGTGLDRAVVGEWAALIERLDAAAHPLLALDIPSGLCADTGAVLGCALRADLTVTFIGQKQGLFTGQGRAFAGEVVLDDLDVPAAVHARLAPGAWRASAAREVARLPARSPAAHKGSHGHVLIIGGDDGYLGAVRLAGEAAARTGAGLVSVATRAAHAALVSAQRPELMARPVESAAALAPLLERASVLAIGPGLGQGPWGRSMLGAVLQDPRPLVIDADGLNLVAADSGLERLALRPGPTVLTPHPGEAGRLLGSDAAAIESDRFAAVRALAQRAGAVVVLKGAGSLVSADGDAVSVCDDGNAGMATAGMGDVLTGVVAALIAQRVPVAQAALAATCVHAAAGDRAACAGQRGMLAGDVVAELRAVLAS